MARVISADLLRVPAKQHVPWMGDRHIAHARDTVIVVTSLSTLCLPRLLRDIPYASHHLHLAVAQISAMSSRRPAHGHDAHTYLAVAEATKAAPTLVAAVQAQLQII